VNPDGYGVPGIGRRRKKRTRFRDGVQARLKWTANAIRFGVRLQLPFCGPIAEVYAQRRPIPKVLERLCRACQKVMNADRFRSDCLNKRQPRASLKGCAGGCFTVMVPNLLHSTSGAASDSSPKLTPNRQGDGQLKAVRLEKHAPVELPNDVLSVFERHCRRLCKILFFKVPPKKKFAFPKRRETYLSPRHLQTAFLLATARPSALTRSDQGRSSALQKRCISPARARPDTIRVAVDMRQARGANGGSRVRLPNPDTGVEAIPSTRGCQ